MRVKLLSEHHLGVLAEKEAAQARLSLHLSKCHILEITCHGSYIDDKKYYMYATYNFTMCANFTKCEILI